MRPAYVRGRLRQNTPNAYKSCANNSCICMLCGADVRRMPPTVCYGIYEFVATHCYGVRVTPITGANRATRGAGRLLLLRHGVKCSGDPCHMTINIAPLSPTSPLVGCKLICAAAHIWASGQATPLPHVAPHYNTQPRSRHTCAPPVNAPHRKRDVTHPGTGVFTLLILRTSDTIAQRTA